MENLINYLKIILRSDLCAETYAKGLLEEAHGDHQEIKGQHTASKCPICFYLSDFGIEL